MRRYHSDGNWYYEGLFSFLWEARGYVKKQIKKSTKAEKKYSKYGEYVEYWP